jgi:hypothetical protein
MKTQIMQEIGVKMEESNKEVNDTWNSVLGLVCGLSGNHNWKSFHHSNY